MKLVGEAFDKVVGELSVGVEEENVLATSCFGTEISLVRDMANLGNYLFEGRELIGEALSERSSFVF